MKPSLRRVDTMVFSMDINVRTPLQLAYMTGPFLAFGEPCLARWWWRETLNIRR